LNRTESLKWAEQIQSDEKVRPEMEDTVTNASYITRKDRCVKNTILKENDLF